MKRLPHGHCAYCDSERGVDSAWGMSPEGWASMKDEHDAGHPNYGRNGIEDTTPTPPKAEEAEIEDFDLRDTGKILETGFN